MTKQCERLYNYLAKNKSINPMQSWQTLGIYRLSARIDDLRKLGYEIETQRESTLNRFNEKVSFAKYVLKDK